MKSSLQIPLSSLLHSLGSVVGYLLAKLTKYQIIHLWKDLFHLSVKIVLITVSQEKWRISPKRKFLCMPLGCIISSEVIGAFSKYVSGIQIFLYCMQEQFSIKTLISIIVECWAFIFCIISIWSKGAPHTSGVLLHQLREDTFACCIGLSKTQIGNNVLQLTKLGVFLRYRFFFPDLHASKSTSFITGSLVPLVPIRCLPPSRRTNSENKLNKQIGIDRLPANCFLKAP